MRSRSHWMGLLLVLGLGPGSLVAGEPPDAATESLKKYMPERDRLLRLKPELATCWSRSAGSWVCLG